MNVAIIIPARYGSSRLPGKPLIEIAGISMIKRVVSIAEQAARSLDGFDSIQVVVATDHSDIADHLKDSKAQVVMTNESCQTGTDRVYDAACQLAIKPDFIMNLQGDAPLTPASFLVSMMQALVNDNSIESITCATLLAWSDLDILRENKKTTPFSGTTVTVDANSNAYWFSKNIIPAIRDEDKLREQNTLSPVRRHIGLYGYTFEFLSRYIKAPQSHYELLESLEQLRILDMGTKLHVVDVDYGDLPQMSGVDTPEDVQRATDLLT